MKLSDLVRFFDSEEISGATDIEITDICYHSGNVKPGSLFVAIPGLKTDGRGFVLEAVQKGAKALVLEGEFFDNLGITQIRTSGVRLALAKLSAAFFVHPTKEFYLSGVTGTNGKTTLTHLTRSLWQAAKRESALIGTVSIQYKDKTYETSHTTPESRYLQEIFSDMKKAGVTHVAMEVSSHAISQDRVSACHFNSCVFTNLTQDHLDFHSSLKEYFEAKQLLFIRHLQESEKTDKLALVFSESAYSSELIQNIKKKGLPLWCYGWEKGNDIYPKQFQINLKGTQAVLETPAGEINISSPLRGHFNLLNMMGAVGVALHSGLTGAQIEMGIKEAMGAKGRMERIPDASGKLLFVDYAHTPDALTNVLKAIRDLKPSRVITVFGCGGDRDKTKRPLMGKEAQMYSDICVITSDNPRTENPQKIIDDILGGMSKDKPCFVESDRKKAIGMAYHMAKNNDVVLVAGKGHEDYQIIGTTKHPFSDQDELQKLVKMK